MSPKHWHKAAPQARKSIVKAGVKKSKSSFQTASEALAEAAEAVKKFVEGSKDGNDGEYQQLSVIAQSISQLVRSKDEATPSDTPESGQSLGELFIYKDMGKRLLILAPVDILRCDKGSQELALKNIAFFRTKGTYFPLKYAISGWTWEVPHPKLLHSRYWLEQIRLLADFYHLDFRTNGWDVHHGMALGDGFACHAENQAMIAAAFWLLRKFTGKEPAVGLLRRLRKFETGKEIDIGISDEPCKECRKFKEFLEDETGIKFNFLVLGNLGFQSKVKSSNGKKQSSKLGRRGNVVQQMEVDEEEEYGILNDDFELPHGSRLEIVIRSKASLRHTATPPRAENAAEEPRMPMIQTSTATVVKQAAQLKTGPNTPKSSLQDSQPLTPMSRSPAAKVTIKSSRTTTYRSSAALVVKRSRKRDYWSEDEEFEPIDRHYLTGSHRSRKSPRSGSSSVATSSRRVDVEFGEEDLEELQRALHRKSSH